ncbi:hypothetical protein ABTE32_22355, partial [Acinetobacter baumannii]
PSAIPAKPLIGERCVIFPHNYRFVLLLSTTTPEYEAIQTLITGHYADFITVETLTPESAQRLPSHWPKTSYYLLRPDQYLGF